MFGLDMTLWNRVQYSSRKVVLTAVRDTVTVAILVGICSWSLTTCASKIISTLAGVS